MEQSQQPQTSIQGEHNLPVAAEQSVKESRGSEERVFATRPQQLSDSWEKFGDGVSFPTEEELRERIPMNIFSMDQFKAEGLGGINIRALAFACAEALCTEEVPQITYLTSGTFNAIFSAQFPGGKEVLARIPIAGLRVVGNVASQVATMAYARFCAKIPTPFVYAWSDSEDNPVGAPYIVMEKVEGVSLATVWRRMGREDKAAALFELARFHTRLARRVHFSEFGSPFFSDNVADGRVKDLSDVRAYRVGPLVRIRGGEHLSWPSHITKDIRSLWKEGYQAEWTAVCERWGKADANEVVDENIRKELWLSEPEIRWGEFEVAARHVLELIESCEQSDSSWPCLAHADFALRNIIVDKEHYYEVRAILDWDGAAILPAELLPMFPDELRNKRALPSDCSVKGVEPHDEVAILESVIPGRYRSDAISRSEMAAQLCDIMDVADDAEKAHCRKVYKLMLRGKDARLNTEFWEKSERVKDIHWLVERGFSSWYHEWERLLNMRKGKEEADGPGKDESSSTDVDHRTK